MSPVYQQIVSPEQSLRLQGHASAVLTAIFDSDE